jgi:hypothetical protein
MLILDCQHSDAPLPTPLPNPQPVVGFKSLRCARILLAGIETMHMIRKGQLAGPNGPFASAAEEFYSLAN